MSSLFGNSFLARRRKQSSTLLSFGNTFYKIINFRVYVIYVTKIRSFLFHSMYGFFLVSYSRSKRITFVNDIFNKNIFLFLPLQFYKIINFQVLFFSHKFINREKTVVNNCKFQEIILKNNAISVIILHLLKRGSSERFICIYVTYTAYNCSCECGAIKRVNGI